MEALPTGFWSLRAEAAGYPVVQQENLPRTPGQSLDGVEIVFGPQQLDLTAYSEDSEVRGRVVDEDGKPVPNAFIDASDCGSAYSLEDGSFSFRALQRWGYACRLYTRKNGYWQMMSVPYVVLIPGPIGEAEIRLRRGTPVTGRIFGLGPRDLARLRVSGFFGDLDPDCGTGTFWSPGQVEPDGSYRVDGIDSTQKAEVTARTENGSRFLKRSLRLRPGQQKAVLNLKFPPVHSVRGRVVGVDGEPLQGARVVLRTRYVTLTTGTLADGSFSLEAQPEEYRLNVSRLGYVNQEISKVTVRNAPVRGLEVRLSRGGDLRGRISGVELKPGEILEVSLQSLQRPWHVHTSADPEGGAYRLPDLTSGTWEVTAGVWTAEGGGDARTVRRQVIIRPETETVLDFDLQSGLLTLSGRIQGGTSGRVFLELQSNADPSLVNSDYLDGGPFTFTRLQPGSYRLRLKDEDRKVLYEQDVEVPAKDELVIDLADNLRSEP